jgi:hypothetical protein
MVHRLGSIGSWVPLGPFRPWHGPKPWPCGACGIGKPCWRWRSLLRALAASPNAFCFFMSGGGRRHRRHAHLQMVLPRASCEARQVPEKAPVASLTLDASFLFFGDHCQGSQTSTSSSGCGGSRPLTLRAASLRPGSEPVLVGIVHRRPTRNGDRTALASQPCCAWAATRIPKNP